MKLQWMMGLLAILAATGCSALDTGDDAVRDSGTAEEMEAEEVTDPAEVDATVLLSFPVSECGMCIEGTACASDGICYENVHVNGGNPAAYGTLEDPLTGDRLVSVVSPPSMMAGVYRTVDRAGDPVMLVVGNSGVGPGGSP